jgi:DNA-binding MarR family transcriptional regulator
MNTEGYLRMGIRPSLRTTRRVWAELSRTPRVSIREIAARIGISHSGVRYAIAMLVAAGYVEHQSGLDRARRVVVPFYKLTKEKPE